MAEKKVETADLKKVEKAAEAVEKKEKTIKVRFNTVFCASYGSFQLGDEGLIPESSAKELAALGDVEIINAKE